jgi:hypothetical protein
VQEEFALQSDLAHQRRRLREDRANSPGASSRDRGSRPAPLTPAYSEQFRQTQQTPQPDRRMIEQCKQLGLLVAGRLQEIFAQPTDIHQYTRELGKICRDSFLAIDEESNFPQPSVLLERFNTFRSELLGLTAVGQVQTVRLALQSIEARGATGVETETGINMMSLFVRTWDLARGVECQAEYQQAVINVLAHNKKAGGGCDAGIAARLIQPYTAFFYTEMQRRLGQKTKISFSVLS